MKNKHNFHNGFGMGQIMATLLVVLPTIAFIITLMTDYWSIMQEDYKLKLLANQVSASLDNQTNLKDTNLTSTLQQKYKNQCPNGTTPKFQKDANLTDHIIVTITYPHEGFYFKNKIISTQMQTYSYHDQNISITGTCQ